MKYLLWVVWLPVCFWYNCSAQLIPIQDYNLSPVLYEDERQVPATDFRKAGEFICFHRKKEYFITRYSENDSFRTAQKIELKMKDGRYNFAQSFNCTEDRLIISSDQYFSWYDLNGKLLYQTGMYNLKPKNFFFQQAKDSYLAQYPLYPHFFYTGKELFLNVVPTVPDHRWKMKGIPQKERMLADIKLSYYVDSFYVHPRHPLIAFAPFDVEVERKKNAPDFSFFDYKHAIPFHNFIGRYDSIFFQKHQEGKYNIQLGIVNFTVNPVQGEVFVNQAVSPTIKVYDYQGNHLRSFGEKGKHLLAGDSVYWFSEKDWLNIRTFEDSIKKQFHASKDVRQANIDYRAYRQKFKKILWAARFCSRRYGAIYFDTTNNRLFRVYEAPNVSFLGFLKKEDRDTLTSPTYLQIYDHNDHDRLIYDEAVPAPFHILEVKGDTLWAVAGVSDKGLKIVKYVMRKE